jgi:cellobiose dehydrogenase (acceptor)
MGTCKMGTDDGRLPDGTAVVDTNTKIYGTDNMFVVDASIWPGMPSTNPSALIVTASERASDLILALPLPRKTDLVKKYG